MNLKELLETYFRDQFKKIIKLFKIKFDITWISCDSQATCLVVNPITILGYGFLFNCTTVGQASDSMTALT